MKTKLLVMFIACLCVIHVKAQKNSPFTFGVYTSLNGFTAQAHNTDGIADGSDSDFGGEGIVLGFSFGGTIEHSTLNWLVMRSGLLFQQRVYGYSYRDPNSSSLASMYGTRKMSMLTIPLVLRLKPGQVFSFNTGAEFSLALNRSTDEDWNRLIDPEYYWGDIAFYASFEFRLYQGLHIGLGINLGLTPWGKSNVNTGSTPPQEPNTYRNRGVFINLQYVFKRE